MSYYVSSAMYNLYSHLDILINDKLINFIAECSSSETGESRYTRIDSGTR